MTHLPFFVRVTFSLDGILGRETYLVAAAGHEVAMAMAGVFLGIEIGMRYSHGREALGAFRIHELFTVTDLPFEVPAQ